MWGISKVMCPSRFLKEVPQHFLTSFSEETLIEKEDDDWFEETGFKAGTTVFHKDFGKGIIKKSYKTSLGLTYDVEFLESNSTRSLVGKYAKFKVCTD